MSYVLEAYVLKPKHGTKFDWVYFMPLIQSRSPPMECHYETTPIKGVKISEPLEVFEVKNISGSPTWRPAYLNLSELHDMIAFSSMHNTYSHALIGGPYRWRSHGTNPTLFRVCDLP